MIFSNEDKIVYNGVESQVFSLLKELGLDFASYRGYVLSGMNAQDAFNMTLLTSDKRKKNKVLLARNKILEMYPSVKDFCIIYHIRYDSFLRLLSKYPQLDLTSILFEYMTLPHDRCNCNYIVSGVSLEAICIHYQLNYDYCMKLLRSGFSVDDALLDALSHSVLIPRKISGKFQEVLKEISVLKEGRSLEIDSNIYPYVISYFQRKRDILDALNVYTIVNFFEHHWECLYGHDIKLLHQKFLDPQLFFQAYRLFEDFMHFHLLKRFKISEEDFACYYEKYYCDYVRVNLEQESVWVYNRKKIYRKEEY